MDDSSDAHRMDPSCWATGVRGNLLLMKGDPETRVPPEFAYDHEPLVLQRPEIWDARYTSAFAM